MPPTLTRHGAAKFATVREAAKLSTNSIIKAAFGKSYAAAHHDAEVIVRIPQLIALKNGVTNEAKAACPELFAYFVDTFLPRCRDHLWTLRQKYLILPLEREQPRPVALLDI